MELRGCSHLHYILAIKHGSIAKTMNIGRRGKPALVFKKVKDIYESEDSKCLHSFPACQPKDEFRSVFFGHDRFEIDSPCSSIEEGNSIKTGSETCEIGRNAGDDHSFDKMTLNQLNDMVRANIDPDTCEINCNDGDDKKDSDLDDLNCDKMTLNQLKNMVRRKKRKHSSYVYLTKINGKNCSPIKEEYPNLQSMEDDIDLKAPLSCLKLKRSKKKVRINKCVSSSSQSDTAISVKSEEISSDQGLLQFSEYPSAPIKVKIEFFEPDNSDCQSVVCLADDSSVGCHKQVGSNVKNSGMFETANECVLKNGECFFTEQRDCVVNGVSYDHLECTEIGPLPDVTAISRETLKVDDPKVNSHQSSVLSLSQLNEQEDANHPHFQDLSQEIPFPAEDHNSSVYDSSQCYSIPHEISRQEKGRDVVQQTDIAVNGSLQCLEPSDGGGVCVFGDDKDDIPCKLNTEVECSCMSNCSSPNKSNPCLSPDSFLAHVNDDSPIVDKKQPLIYNGGYPTRKRSAEIQFCDTSNELSTSELTENCHNQELQHPPERLFSNRKAISPTSQEKLCKAMNAIELHDDIEHYKCREKLCFQNKASREIEESEVDANTEGTEQASGVEVIINCKQIKRRPKNCSKGSRPKGILKVRQLSRSLSRVTTGCTSIQSCSRSAIAFSQRQMQDIECLAMKLTKELNSMKDIVEDALHSEGCLSTSLKYNSDEVKTAIGNARKVEESAKKWLSMMARDCNRFCKIMTLTETDNKDSGSPDSKNRKKISFADEAGGKLCHVKVFEVEDTVSVVL